MMHTVCAAFLRKVFHAEGRTLDEITDLAEIRYILGRCLPRGQAGRIPHIAYENAHPQGVDLNSFWSETRSIGRPKFDWNRLVSNNLGWTLSRPDAYAITSLPSATLASELPTPQLPGLSPAHARADRVRRPAGRPDGHPHQAARRHPPHPPPLP